MSVERTERVNPTTGVRFVREIDYVNDTYKVWRDGALITDRALTDSEWALAPTVEELPELDERQVHLERVALRELIRILRSKGVITATDVQVIRDAADDAVSQRTRP